MRERKKRKEINDPNLPFIKIRPGYGYSELHNSVVAFLASLIHRAGFKVNYAHSYTTVPKTESLPLYIEYKGVKGHAEICFELDSNHLVFIDLLVINKKLLRRADQNGQNHKNL